MRGFHVLFAALLAPLPTCACGPASSAGSRSAENAPVVQHVTLPSSDGLEVSADHFHYCDALIQVQAVLGYARAWKPDAPVIAWGSSYSAALVLHAVAEDATDVDRVLAFSPAAGDPMVGCQPDDVVGRLQVPVLIVRPQSEAEMASVAQQLETFSAAGHQTFVADPGSHGSSTLNPLRTQPGDLSESWQAVLDFLAAGHE